MRDPGEISEAEHLYWEGQYEAAQAVAWALFGWLWLAGGRSELETWTPDETRIAGVDYDELEDLECPLCGCWLGTCDCYLDEGGA